MLARVVNYEYNTPLRPFMLFYSIPRLTHTETRNSLVIFTSGGRNLSFVIYPLCATKAGGQKAFGVSLGCLSG